VAKIGDVNNMVDGKTNSIIEQLIKEEKPIKINLACGQQKQEGFVGIDKVKTDATDIVLDLEQYPWPIPDNCVDELTCSHYVEHVKDLPSFMDEIHRIMKSPYVNKDGEKVTSKVTIICPYYSSMRAMQDPFHIRPICEASFLYYNKQWREVNKLDHYGIKSDFDFSYGYQLSPEWATRSQEARDFAIRHYNNVITDIFVTMTKK
jgi:hypothetical protein